MQLTMDHDVITVLQQLENYVNYLNKYSMFI